MNQFEKEKIINFCNEVLETIEKYKQEEYFHGLCFIIKSLIDINNRYIVNYLMEELQKLTEYNIRTNLCLG